ncbi:MFS transporter [Photobacterium atrarenae]|uniref:MFS transporter n=1 Tax=Photobacterium atrarenae TaxID=865757 RepID=A0ABY5GIQ7_9GAMM|nr:MFS transporter [Photobacterium atrarenae]UTV29168.1 MFS transporter [Photobacterium atrarenae]
MLNQLWQSLALYRGLPGNIYIIAVARFILGLGNFIIPFLLLLLTEKLDYSATLAGTLAMGLMALFVFGGLCGGKLSDSLGHKKIMVWGELAGAVILIACGFYSDDAQLVPLFLFVAYFFFGVALPASNALVADLSTPTNRDAVMSLSYLAFNLGSAAGPLVAGYLFWNFTAWIFWGNGIAALVGIALVMFFIRTDERDGVSEGEAHSALEQAVEGSVWQVLKQRPRLLVFTGLCALLWVALNQMTMTSPLYLNHIFGIDGPVLFGQLMTYACILVVVITPLLMRLTSNQAEIVSLAYAGMMFAAGYALVMVLPTIPIHFFAWFFLSAAEVLLVTKEGVYLANHSPKSHRGRIQGVLTTMKNLIVLPSFTLMGLMIDHWGFENSWLVVIGVSVGAATCLAGMVQYQNRTGVLAQTT